VIQWPSPGLEGEDRFVSPGLVQDRSVKKTQWAKWRGSPDGFFLLVCRAGGSERVANIRLKGGDLPSGFFFCAGLVSSSDTVGVIGSSHSAVLVLMNLLEMQHGPQVVNLFRSPLKYAKYLPNGTIILDNTGLKVRDGAV
jgi:hypothetical protein